MSAEVQAGLTPAQMNDAVTEQMISGLNQLDAYVDFRAARAADLAALKQHYQQQVGTPNTGNGGGNTGGRGGGLDP